MQTVSVLRRADKPQMDDYQRFIGRFRRYLMGRSFSPKTCDDYIKWVRTLARHYDLKTVGSIPLEEWIFDTRVGHWTREARYNACAKFFGYARKVRWRTNNPMLQIERPREPGLRLPRPASNEAVTAALKVTDPVLRTTVAVAALAGLRVGEIAALRWEFIDFENHRLTVIQGKGKKDRVVPLSDKLTKILRQLPVKKHGPILPGRWNGTIDSRWLSQIVSKGMTDLGYSFTCHQFRHWFATVVYRETRDLLIVKELLGHATLKTTLNYVSLAGIETRGAVDAVSTYIEGMPRAA